MFIVVIGSIVDGYVFIGPFEENIEAIEFGGRCGADEWWVTKLVNQDDMAMEA